MRIIDLLNKIANGEEVPKKIRYKTFELERTQSEEVKRLYVDEQGMFFPEYYSFDLNDEVEIIEENKKIENIYHCCMETNNKETKFLIENINDLADKINEIIDRLNEMEK